MQYRKFLLALLFGMIILCGSGTAARAQSPSNTLVVAIAAEPTNVDPLTLSWNNGFVGGQLFNPLLGYAPDLSIEQGLASTWTVDSQAGTYTFNLRQGVLWSDGQPFTSQDVKFTYEQIIPKYDTYGFFFANTTVSTPDNYTAVIKPGLFLPGEQLALFASGDGEIYPQHVLQGQDYLKSTFRTTNPVGTGPYMLTKWVAGQYIQLDRNPYYWDKPRPYIDTILIKFISDPAAVTAGLQRGEINFVNPEGIPYEVVKSLSQNPNLNVTYSTQPPYVGAFWINLKAPYVSDVKVRQAIAYALNRSEFIQSATAGIALPGQAPIDPDYAPPSPTMTIYDYDAAKANSLLDAAGYARIANGTRFTIQILVPNSQPELISDAQIAKTQLANVGIGVSIKITDFGTYIALEGQENFQIFAVTYWTHQVWLYNLYDSKFIGAGPFENPSQWSNPQVDQVLDQYLRTSDHAQQIKLLQQFEDIFSQELPAVILYRENWVYVMSSNVHGPSIPDGRYIFVEPHLAEETLASSTVSTTTTSATTAPDYALPAAAAIVVIVIVVAAIVAMRRRKTSSP